MTCSPAQPVATIRKCVKHRDDIEGVKLVKPVSSVFAWPRSRLADRKCLPDFGNYRATGEETSLACHASCIDAEVIADLSKLCTCCMRGKAWPAWPVPNLAHIAVGSYMHVLKPSPGPAGIRFQVAKAA